MFRQKIITIKTLRALTTVQGPQEPKPKQSSALVGHRDLLGGRNLCLWFHLQLPLASSPQGTGASTSKRTRSKQCYQLGKGELGCSKTVLLSFQIMLLPVFHNGQRTKGNEDRCPHKTFLVVPTQAYLSPTDYSCAYVYCTINFSIYMI